MNAVVRPWKDEWQLWKPGKKAGVRVLDQRSPLEQLRIPDKACCALPARLVVAISLWIEASDEDTVREIARLEMEMKGLAAGDRSATEVEILRTEEGRALVRGTVFPNEWPDYLRALKGASYRPSPLVVAYGGDGVHLWREFDDLVAVVVWNDQVICWETLYWPADPAEVASWLRRFMIQLEDELGLREPFLLKEWFGVFEEVPEPFGRVEALRDADREIGPPLRKSFSPTNWLPGAVKEFQNKQGNRRKLVRFVGGIAGVLLIAVLVFLFLSLRISQKIAETDRQIARIEQEIAPLQATARKWTQVEHAIDRKYHPLEILREAIGALPQAGVRLTVFQMAPDRVLIEGEAENVSAATGFFQKLEESSRNGLHWQMTPPALQPNNTARFAITGGRDGQ